MTAELQIKTYDPDRGAPRLDPIDLTAGRGVVSLRCVPGASAIHLAVLCRNEIRLQAEVEADPGEEIELVLEAAGDTVSVVARDARRVLTLPAEARLEPPLPRNGGGAGEALDLALVLDGTMLIAAGKSQTLERLVGHPEEWPETVDYLLELLDVLAAGSADLRVTVMAFGDTPVPGITARDLLPSYLLEPPADQRLLAAFDPAALRDRLLHLPSSAGGDFVDALGDALDAALYLRWRRRARQLALLLGDSPGHSLHHPAPPGADGQARTFDVDEQAMELHRQGIELATIYCDLPADNGMYGVDFQRRLLEHARQQYGRLASRPELAFLASQTNASEVAERLLAATGPVARGPCLGILAESLSGTGDA